MNTFPLPRVSNQSFKNLTVLARVDFNVTVDEKNRIRDASKILENIETINYLANQGAKILLLSHRSTEKRDGQKTKPSFRLLIKEIETILKKKLQLIDICTLSRARKEIATLDKGEIALFDNTRLHPGEETCDTSYGRELAKLGDIFVYDAFASYRPETTTVVLPRFLPTFVGFTMEKEITMLSSIFHKPRRPLICIIGGAKTEVKVGIVRRFLAVADTVVLGGSVANTFLKAWGIELGGSLVDEEMVIVAKELLWLALHSRVALELPHDFLISKIGSSKSIRIASHTKIRSGFSAYDIGPATCKRYSKIIGEAGTVVWNGPMGLYEREEFRQGTLSILDSVVSSSATKIVGGGDTITALPKHKRKGIDHVSTGGGAMLVFLESGTTPPIEAIRKYHHG